MREWVFEQRLCARLEARGELVARQLGAGVTAPANRVVDVVQVAPGPGFDARKEITDAAVPELVLEADVGAGQARYWKDAIRDLDVHPDRARSAIERAVEIGFLETERRKGRLYVRLATRYPDDWFGELTTIENKPDLDAAGDLETQLRTDVSLAVADRVVLVTASYVTRAHLNRLPEPVGIWRFQPGTDEVEVVREPTRLSVDTMGIELLERRPGRDEIRVVDAASKACARRRLAERAYGKGWRPAGPAGCGHATVRTVAGIGGLTACSHFDRLVDPVTDCGAHCPAYEAAEPPEFDRGTVRDRHSPWVADPPGWRRRQGSLDGFVGEDQP